MGDIKPFEPADALDVSRLFMKVFRKSHTEPPTSLCDYISRLYLTNPWNNPAFPSWVYRDEAGRLRGFIGSIPRPMSYMGKQIHTVVAGNHMVDGELESPFPAVLLLRRLLSGPQDLTYSDSANEASVRMWEASGGMTIPTYSLRWLRLLRPFSWALMQSPARNRLKSLKTMALPLARCADHLARRAILDTLSEGPLPDVPGTVLRPELMLESLDLWEGEKSLKAVYNRSSLEWILEAAKEKSQYGPMYTHAVFRGPTLIGWYVFFARLHGVAEVLRIASKPSTFQAVFRHLCSIALRMGSTAVSGMVDPNLIRELSSEGCFFFQRNVSTVAHSTSSEIIGTLFAGDAVLTRLEAEWWTRLQGDTFEGDPE